jgi:DNA-binding MarR family transcriptional regulator
MQRTAVSTEQLTEELMQFLSTTMKSTQGDVFRIVEELDLTMSQFKIIHVLDGAERELTPSELAKLVGLSPAATGRAVDALTRNDIVSRRDDDEDRRVKRLGLTGTGQEIVGRIVSARRAGLAGYLDGLTPQQREALSSALQPLLTPHSPCKEDG